MLTVDFIAFIWGVHAATKLDPEPPKCNCTCKPVSIVSSTPDKISSGNSGDSFWLYILLILLIWPVGFLLLFLICRGG